MNRKLLLAINVLLLVPYLVYDDILLFRDGVLLTPSLILLTGFIYLACRVQRLLHRRDAVVSDPDSINEHTRHHLHGIWVRMEFLQSYVFSYGAVLMGWSVMAFQGATSAFSPSWLVLIYPFTLCVAMVGHTIFLRKVKIASLRFNVNL